MNVQILTDIGLSETQAKMYIALIKNGNLTPPNAAELLNIKRTNAYAVLEQLDNLGLAKKKELNKKVSYWAENPTAIEKLARDNRSLALEHERQVQASMPTLLNFYYTFSDQPGVRFFQGLEGIKDIYNDILRTNKDVYVVRSAHDQDLMSEVFFTEFKKKKADRGITTHMINPKNDPAYWNKQTDKHHRTIRTQVHPELYTANVEICSYGDKVSIISFGEEAIGMIIDSPQIAEANRQLFHLAKLGAETASKNHKKNGIYA
ncbi:hypothetical protein KC960_00710 [Candidatus Saccharibacteria bacterium]|nr:hypothetical protein [Candidatus Saccharibacteria bacterium]